MPNLFSTIISFIVSTRNFKEIALFVCGVATSLLFFFGGGIFVAHSLVSGIPGVLLGILFGIGAMFAVAFLIGILYISKIKKLKLH